MLCAPENVWRVAVWATLLGAACTGAIDEGDDSAASGGGPGSTPAMTRPRGGTATPPGEGAPGLPPGESKGAPLPSKDPNDRPASYARTAGQTTGHQPLRRLTRLQLLNTISELVDQLVVAEAALVKRSIAPHLDRIPTDKYTSIVDKGRDGFTNADQDVTQVHADAAMALAVALGRSLTESESRRRALFGACAVDASASNDVTCVDDFVRKWGPRILRGGVSDDDVAFYRRGLRGTTASPEALADVVALLFAAPRFAFHVETVSTAASSPPAELSSRLSYLLWDAPPDADLVKAVDSGELATEAGYRTQAQRLLRSPRAAATVERFYREWFSLQSTPNLTASLGLADYKAFVGTEKPTAAATAGMVEDVMGLVRDIYSKDRPMMDFLTDRRVYTKDPYVASIYGVTLNPSEFPQPPSAARVGFITRPAFVASRSQDLSIKIWPGSRSGRCSCLNLGSSVSPTRSLENLGRALSNRRPT